LKISLIVFCLLMLAACAAPTAPTGEGPEVKTVSMRLQWVPQFQFAGYIVALQEGYYAEEGLDVTINPGGPDAVSLPLVASGADTFGSTGADTVLIAREKDIDVVALATIFQASPVAFMVHADSGIAGPADFVGRTVGMFYGDNVETEYRALLAAAEVDRSQINEIPGDFSLAPFLDRRADVWPVYATDQPYTARREGAEVKLILARDYGVELLGDVLFTTGEFVRENPNTVAAFVRATLRGWQFALEKPAEANALIAAYNSELNPEQLAFESQETIPLIRFGVGASCPGYNSRSAWQAEATILEELAITTQSADLDAAIDNRFVAEYYAAQGVSCE
jgi:ABC-type nitrate/sulfonate/bicarbonate transport system substrate-binding protein